MSTKVGGIIYIRTNGIVRNAKGAFDYNLGAPKRDAVVGHDAVHGFSEIPQAPMLSGILTDTSTLDVKNDILNLVDATITLELNNGKTVVFRNASYTGEGNINTEQGEIQVEFKAFDAEEI